MKRLFASILVALSILCVAAPASAYDPFAGFKTTDGGCNNSAANGVVCNTDGQDNISGTNGVLAKVTNIIALLAGVAAVILIIISGFQFITSGGDSSKVAGARNALIGAIVGVLIVAFAQAILVFVLKAT